MRASATAAEGVLQPGERLDPGAAQGDVRERRRVLCHCLHELCHWSEHESRLNWSRKDKENTYALGELVAEIGSCYLCRELGVPASDDLTNHIAYVGNWLQAMRNDPRFIFVASGLASKAADFILGFSRKPEDVPEPRANWRPPEPRRERSPAP